MISMDDKRRFYRFYCSFACQVKISDMCAPVVAIDAGHMKTEAWCKYVCLVACTIDGNRRNQLLAFAIVPSESEEDYIFFINTMIGSQLRKFVFAENLVCLTDRGKAVLAGIRKSLPSAANRYCAMHLLGNLSKLLKVGTDARRQYNKLVYSHENDEFDEAYKSLLEICPEVIQDMEDIGLDRIAQSCLPTDIITYGQRTSNLAEQRMAWLKDPVRGSNPVTGIVSMLLKLNRSYNRQLSDLQRAKDENLLV
jgi:hypothetical protein